MGLQFPSEWRFEGIGFEMPSSAHRRFIEVIGNISPGHGGPKAVYETIKGAYGNSSNSSSTSFAESDMHTTMGNAKVNAAMYVASFWDAMLALKEGGLDVPTVKFLNKILSDESVPLVIDLPNLRRLDADALVSDEEQDESDSLPFYRRTATLGNGGFGVVYKVTRTTSVGEFDFAMKVFDPQPFVHNKKRALDRFHREIQILRKLQHRGIVPIFEAGVDHDQNPYILMPVIDGDDLHCLSQAEPPRVVSAFADVLDALSYAHHNDVIHRDLRPENVLIRHSDGQPIILDFGCGYMFDDMTEAVLTTRFVGTTKYAPIEVIRDPTHKTVHQDVYAVGIMLYQMLMNDLPNLDDYEPIESAVDGLGGIDRIVKKAIAPLKKRADSAEEFRDQLRELAR
jgi:serine/threonine protein kinase